MTKDELLAAADKLDKVASLRNLQVNYEKGRAPYITESEGPLLDRDARAALKLATTALREKAEAMGGFEEWRDKAYPIAISRSANEIAIAAWVAGAAHATALAEAKISKYGPVRVFSEEFCNEVAAEQLEAEDRIATLTRERDLLITEVRRLDEYIEEQSLCSDLKEKCFNNCPAEVRAIVEEKA